METIGAHRQGLAEAVNDEPDYLKLVKSMVGAFDRAMTAEGVDAEVRDRVVSRVLYGTPLPDVGPPVNGGASVRRTLAESR